jgi:hypothetical protein
MGVLELGDPRFNGRQKVATKNEAIAAIYKYGSVRKAAKALGIPRQTLHDFATAKHVTKRLTQGKFDIAVGKLPPKEQKEFKTISEIVGFLKQPGARLKHKDITKALNEVGKKRRVELKQLLVSYAKSRKNTVMIRRRQK